MQLETPLFTAEPQQGIDSDVLMPLLMRHQQDAATDAPPCIQQHQLFSVVTSVASSGGQSNPTDGSSTATRATARANHVSIPMETLQALLNEHSQQKQQLFLRGQPLNGSSSSGGFVPLRSSSRSGSFEQLAIREGSRTTAATAPVSQLSPRDSKPRYSTT
jgi:hypothetical protein